MSPHLPILKRVKPKRIFPLLSENQLLNHSRTLNRLLHSRELAKTRPTITRTSAVESNTTIALLAMEFPQLNRQPIQRGFRNTVPDLLRKLEIRRRGEGKRARLRREIYDPRIGRALQER